MWPLPTTGGTASTRIRASLAGVPSTRVPPVSIHRTDTAAFRPPAVPGGGGQFPARENRHDRTDIEATDALWNFGTRPPGGAATGSRRRRGREPCHGSNRGRPLRNRPRAEE